MISLEPSIIWHEVMPGIHTATTATGANLLVARNITTGHYAWSVTNSHRPDRSGSRVTLADAQLVAECYLARGITHLTTDNDTPPSATTPPLPHK